jgi:hypothetical protein
MHPTKLLSGISAVDIRSTHTPKDSFVLLLLVLALALALATVQHRALALALGNAQAGKVTDIAFALALASVLLQQATPLKGDCFPSELLKGVCCTDRQMGSLTGMQCSLHVIGR